MIAEAAAPQVAVREATEALWVSRDPFIVGVRHHSPALAAAMPRILDEFAPERVLIELPMELEPWIEWLAHPDTIAPIALAAVREDGGDLSFYPFADFSPELAAIRWAVRAGIPIGACDLPWSSSGWRSTPDQTAERATDAGGESLTGHLYRATGVHDGEELWDRLVEVRAPGSSPEAIRRAALSVGWALRRSSAQISETDLQREAWMRQEIERPGGRTAVVVGAFHAPALIRSAAASSRPGAPSDKRSSKVVTSLIRYTFPLLDSRSGYPAGIRDPEWQQAAFESGLDGAAIGHRTGAFAVLIAAAMRDAGHAAGTVDAMEVLRVATDLARLRGVAAPGRELVEACAAVLGQGEPLGRGRAVARAMGHVLVGGRRGRLPADAPRSGLGPHVEELVATLRLPGPGDPAVEMRLDPLRSDLDRRRHIALQRLTVCGVPYGRLREGAALGAETLTQHWTLGWEPATSAMVDLAGLHGVTLGQASEGAIRSAMARAMSEHGGVTPAMHLASLHRATECSLAAFAEELLGGLQGAFLDDAGLAELVIALEQVERIGRAHVPGFTPSKALAGRLTGEIQPQLLTAAVRRLEGVSGSDRAEDAAALATLVRRVDADDGDVGGARIWLGARPDRTAGIAAHAGRLGGRPRAHRTSQARRLRGTPRILDRCRHRRRVPRDAERPPARHEPGGGPVPRVR